MGCGADSPWGWCRHARFCRTPHQSKIKDFCQLSHRESQGRCRARGRLLGAVVDGEMTTPQSASLTAPLARGALGAEEDGGCGANRSSPINTNLKKGGEVRGVRCGCGGGAGENRGKLFRNKRKMSESVLRSVAGCATMIAGKKERGAWRWNRIDAPGV